MGTLNFEVNVDGRRLTGVVDVIGLAADNDTPNLTAFDAVGDITFRGTTHRIPVQFQVSNDFSATPGAAAVDGISIGFEIDGVLSLLGGVSTNDTGVLGSTLSTVSLADFDGSGEVGVFDAEALTSTTTAFSSFAFTADGTDPIVVVPTDDADLFEGTPEADRFDGGRGDDTLNGLAGRDTLEGGAGRDEINGGAGADSLFGDGGRDVLRGEGGRDDLFGGAGRDELFGGRGRDDLFGNGGRDALFGEGGRDMLAGGGGRDRLDGGGGRDALAGGAGRDTIDGGAGRDTLEGGGARDVLEGGAGGDFLTGGAGVDTFVFAAGDGADVITDFTVGQDLIDLQAFAVGFQNLNIGAEGEDAVVTIGDVTITLVGVDETALQEDDFIF